MDLQCTPSWTRSCRASLGGPAAGPCQPCKAAQIGTGQAQLCAPVSAVDPVQVLRQAKGGAIVRVAGDSTLLGGTRIADQANSAPGLEHIAWVAQKGQQQLLPQAWSERCLLPDHRECLQAGERF